MRLFNPGSPLLLDQPRVLLRRAGTDGTEPRRLEHARAMGEDAIVLLEGVRTREQANALRGFELCVERSALPPVEEGEHYHVDLVGLRVRREDGAPVGEVVEVIAYPSVDCLRVRASDGKGDLEVPMLDQWLVSIDAEAGEVVVGDTDDLPRERRSG